MTSSLPKTMRALLHSQTKQTLTLAKAHLIPSPKENEYLLKVSATAFTTGELDWPRPPELAEESVPGVEMSGTVVTAPAGSKFPEGSEVYMRTTYPQPGSAREYTIGLESELAFKPKNITAAEAASVPVSALTAWQGLFIHAGLEPNFSTSKDQLQSPRLTILVNGASSGAGLWFTQLAHAAGYFVVGICSTKNVTLVRSIGADEVIDYTQTSLRSWIDEKGSKFDHVFDCVGLHKTPDCWYAAKDDGGRVWTIVLPPGGEFKWERDTPEGIDSRVKGRFFIMEAIGDHLGKVTELIEAGKVKPVVDSVWKLEEYEKAFARLDTGRAVGKVVMTIQE